MKAIILKRYGGKENFELADIPVPPVQKGQIRVRIMAISFNPVDYQIRRGLNESRLVTSNILGRDISGIVDEVDKEVKEFEIGDEVYSYVSNLGSSGTYTEYICIPAAIAAKKPAYLSHEQAASIPVAGITAMLALSKAKADKSKSIFIAGGAGGVGSFAITFAIQSGIRNIVTTAGNDRSISYLVENLGMKKEQIINYKDDDFINQALEKNKGNFEVAIDLVGGRMLSACCDLLAIDGNLASIVDAPTHDEFETLFQKNGSFHSIGANAYSLSKIEKDWRIYQRILNHISVLYDTNEIKKPPITVLGPLSVTTVQKGHDLLENHSVQGKLVMIC